MRLCRGSLALTAFAFLLSLPTAHGQTVLFWGTPSQAAIAQMGINLKSAIANLSLATDAKAELYRQIIQARQQVTNACQSKKHDEGAEAQFVALLGEKDFYYLPFYMPTASNSRSVTSVLQRATGGEIDGGIRPEAELAFVSWAAQMKTVLGMSMMSDKIGVENALRDTQPAYIRYVLLRDRAEIDQITSGKAELSMPDPTPQQFADLYVEKVLKPARASGHALPSGYRPLTDETLEEFRKAIIDWESIKLDPQKIAKITLSGDDKSVIEGFLQTAKSAESDPKTYQLRLIKAYDDAFVASEAQSGILNPLAPGDAVQLSRMKYASDPKAVNRLEELDPKSNYETSRAAIKKDLAPAFDWCTGQRL